MKIAVFDPMPRVCGVTVWGQQLCNGLRELGHHADIVAITRSGRPAIHWAPKPKEQYPYGVRWFTAAPDVVIKPSTAGEVLNSYDLIVLVEPKSPLQDRDVAKGRSFDEFPLYIEALRDTKTPWLSMIHGSHYDAKQAPYMPDCFQSGKFLGKLVASTAQSVEHAAYRFEGITVHPYRFLPYKPVCEDGFIPARRAVGFVGRVVINKGPQMLLEVAVRDLVHADIDIWGACSVSVGPSFTRSMFEYLENNGFSGEILVKEGAKPDVVRPHPWRAWRGTADGNDQVIQYRGNFTWPMDVLRDCSVFASLTSSDFSFGMLEYACLEALDAGCMVVCPPRGQVAKYGISEITDFHRPPTLSQDRPPRMRTDLIDDAVITTFGTLLNDNLNRSDRERLDIAEENRRLLRELHAPAKYAQFVLDVASSK